MTSEILRMSCIGSIVASALVLALSVTSAEAVSLSVRRACAGDYFAYCSAHPVGSPGVRQCMSDAGPKLSKTCVSALVAAGEVSKDEVARRAASLR